MSAQLKQNRMIYLLCLNLLQNSNDSQSGSGPKTNNP